MKMIDRHRDRVQRNLQTAINIMLQACENAEHLVKNIDDDAPSRVMNIFSWASANAYSSLQNAMDAINDNAEEQLLRASERALNDGSIMEKVGAT